MIHNISRFIAALALLATAQGAWAQTPSGNWADWVNDNNIDWSSADAKAAAIPQSDDGSTVFISTAEQLAYYAYAVNNDKEISGSASGYYCGRTVELMADIDLSAHYWKPIGWNKDFYFNGYFHGNGHVITGIHVNGDPKSDGTVYYPCYGLFGYLHTRSGGTSTITDLVLKDFSITASYSGNNSDMFYLGGLVGRCDDNTAITNCLLVNGSVGKSGNNSRAHIGKVAGGGSPSTATANYYHNVSVSGWYDGFDSYAQQTIGGETEARAVALTISSTHGSVALGGTVGRISDGIIYAPANETVTLNATADAGYIASLAATGLTLTSGQFTMPDNDDGAINATVSIDPAHFSVSGDEYTIHTAEGWGVFCDALQDNDTYNRFSGKTVRLGADIGTAESPVTRMAGGSGHEFTGTFDGDGKTLTVNYTNNNNDVRTAPFSYVNGATIQNLIVGGTISGSAYRAAGIVGETPGQTTITNCVSSVDISSGRYTGGISIGGLVTITGCVFNGKIVGTTWSGGFVGYSNTATAISNSLFAPQDGSSISGGTFYYNGGGDITPTNSYYTRALGTAQGKATRTVAAAADVTIEAVALTGTATQYTVSGITAYSGGGLQRGQTLYYGSGDQLSLTLSNSATAATQGYQYGYTASAGTLSGTTLTMPDEDVTISVNTADLAPIDWATVNQGNSADPYMIYNKDQLLLLAHRVNGTNGETVNTYQGKYFKLGADITFDPNDLTLDEGQSNYEAIGHYDGIHEFKGNFNGDGHTVSGIRINKTGSGTAYNCQGLFGLTASGADIYDVHLTDARITGYDYVAGIVGYNFGTVSGCTVTDSYITCNAFDHGTICGRNGGTLTNNYYHGCTVNGTAVTSGVGYYGSDITANNGALPAYRLDLGANITTPPGTFVGQKEWLDTPPASARLAPENGFTLAGNHYFASGYVFTPGSTLASGAAQGYTPRATLGDELLDPYTPTGDDDPLAGKAIARLTITADCDGKTLAAALRSTGQPVTVAYIKSDGTPDEASAIALDGTETSLAAGWYFVGKDISYTQTLTLTGDVTLILKDGCEMNVGESGSEVDGYGINCYDEANDTYYDLTICGQTAQTGTLSVYTTGQNHYAIGTRHITVNGGNVIAHTDGRACGIDTKSSGNVTINRGSVSATTTSTDIFAWPINAHGNLTINGGNVSAKSNSHAILANGNVAINGGTVNATGGDGGYSGIYSNGTIEINGGNVTASSIYSYGTAITLGWTDPTDRITASSISTYDGTVAVADGQALTDGSGNIYTGTLTASELSGFAAETTLQPCLVLNETAGVTPLTAFAGQADVPVMFTRSGLATNAYSTMCLPFGFEKPSDCTFYAFKGVGWSTENSQWEATISETSTLAAHTPYIFKCSDTEATFIGTIASVPSDISNSLVEVSASQGDDTNWKFKGTYTALDWTSAGPTEPTYGFSTYVPAQTIAAGTFVRFVQGASLAPFRARLIYNGSNEHLNARGHSRAAQAESELPRYIIVRIIGADGTATAIGTLDTATGQLSTDGWYTLGGRRLEAKPNAKGIYIHNGRKVIVK